MNPKLLPIFIREKTIQAIRKFFDDQQFHEVITPILNVALPLEPNLYAFNTVWNRVSEKKELYLAMSPEIGLKKMLAEGVGNCYAISKSFRNLEGSGSLHNPEFLMLEWYRENANYETIMRDTEKLIMFVKNNIDTYLKKPTTSQLTFQGKTIDLKISWQIFSLVDLFKHHAQVDLKEIIEDEPRLATICEKKGYIAEKAAWHELFDQIFVNEIEPHIPMTPCFLTDFPSRISPLCEVKNDMPYLAERFELYIFGKEIGNGNTERTDKEVVLRRFKTEKQERLKTGIFSPPIDYQFLDALERMNSKQYGGIGLGVDRLAMIMANCDDIKDVEYFAINQV